MGLNFSQGNAAWSYKGFHEFRKRLAREIGMNLDQMDGFDTPGMPWRNVIDPIAPLLNHADNTGYLTIDDCLKVAPRLRVLVAHWPDDDYDKIAAIKLAMSMEMAADMKVPLRFT